MAGIYKRENSSDDELSIDVTEAQMPKKHKKHKHKKHRHKKEMVGKTASAADVGLLDDMILSEESDLLSMGDMIDMKPALKLKFKIGSHSLGEKSVAIIQEADADEENQLIEVVEDIPLVPAPESDISDEDAWLEALESGKLDEYDEMKRMKDPSLMTARQRALLESKSQRDTVLPEYVMLPLGYKEKEMTEEMIQKREMRAKKRRQQAQEKREKDKIQTIDRLLKKQDPKPKGSKGKGGKKADVPKFTYVNNCETICISVPTGFEFPLQKKTVDRLVLHPVICAVPGCTNLKKYSCSKTGVPLCSLECYKKNLLKCAVKI